MVCDAVFFIYFFEVWIEYGAFASIYFSRYGNAFLFFFLCPGTTELVARGGLEPPEFSICV